MTQISKPVELHTVTEKEHDQRVDNFLVTFLKSVPKGRIYKMIRKGEVRVNKARVRPESRIYKGDVVRIPPVTVSKVNASPAPGKRVIERIEEAVIHEDECLMVINKPSGIAVHGGSGLSYGVIEALRTSRGDNCFLELVHRLDRDTSGCLLIAKNRAALKSLHESLRNNRVDKRYHALVSGRWPRRMRVVEAPLRKNALKSGERVVRVSVDGKLCRTEFRLLSAGSRFSLIEAKPVTGRTHQIRVHCQYAGHSIIGDDKYWDGVQIVPVPPSVRLRLMLHAYQLRFPHPESGRKWVEAVAPYDEVFGQIIDAAGVEYPVDD